MTRLEILDNLERARSTGCDGVTIARSQNITLRRLDISAEYRSRVVEV